MIQRIEDNERVLVTTLTKKMAERLTEYVEDWELKSGICILTLKQ